MIKVQTLVAASSDGGATAGIGIRLATGAAVVVRRTTARAWHDVPPQRAVADVAGGCEDPAIGLGSEIELLPGKALSDCATADGFGRDPAQLVAEVVPAGECASDGGRDEQDEEWNGGKAAPFGHLGLVSLTTRASSLSLSHTVYL